MQVQVTEGGDVRINIAGTSTPVGRWLTKPSGGWAKRVRGRKHQPIRAIFFSRYQIGVIAAKDTEDLRQKAQQAFMRKDQDSIAALLALRTP